MIWYFDLETVQDEKGWYLRIPKVWLLDYTPQMITQISAESFFDLDCAYLKYQSDGNLFEETLCRDPIIETESRDSKFIEKFTEHCLEHKIPFSLTGFFLGAVIAFVAGLGTAEFAGLLVAFGGIFGGGIGILAALLFDVFLRGRGSKLQATKIVE